MKLLYTLTTYSPAIGGAQLHQHLLAQHLQPRHDIQVVTHWDRNRTDWLLGTTLNAPATNHDYTINKIFVHREAFLQRCGIKEPMILFLGQHYPYKGYRQRLQATAEVWKKIPEARFVFIGPDVANSAKVFARYSDPRIHRLGSVDLQTKTDALAACTLLCVPSSQESFGGVYTEAWSFAKLVIGCNIPAVAEVIADGVDGYLVPQDPKSISDAICQVLFDRSLHDLEG